MEYVYKTILENEHFSMCSTLLTNLESNTAAHSSRRGKEIVLIGATRNFAAISVEVLFPWLSVTTA